MWTMWEKSLFSLWLYTATTFTTKACQEAFKIQNGPSACDSEEVHYLLKCKVCGEVPYVRKANTKFRYRFNNYESKDRAFEKVIKKLLRNYFTLTIVLIAIAALKIGIL